MHTDYAPKAFYSHSTDPSVKDANNWFVNMIRAAGMTPEVLRVHVSGGRTVPEAVKKGVREADCLVAFIPSSEQAGQAVRGWMIEEVTLAEYHKKPMVIFVEPEVRLETSPLAGHPVTQIGRDSLAADAPEVTRALVQLRGQVYQSHNLLWRIRKMRQSFLRGADAASANVLRRVQKMHIRDVYNIPDDNTLRDERMAEVLAEVSNKYRLLARSGRSYLAEGGPNWERGVRAHLEEGRPMDVILQDPYSQNGAWRREADGNVGAWVDISVDRLEKVAQDYEHLSISFTGLPVFCSVFLTDASVFFDPYHYGRLSDKKYRRAKNDFFVAEFLLPDNPEPTDFYPTLDRHFEYVKAHPETVPLATFLKKHSRPPDVSTFEKQST